MPVWHACLSVIALHYSKMSDGAGGSVISWRLRLWLKVSRPKQSFNPAWNFCSICKYSQRKFSWSPTWLGAPTFQSEPRFLSKVYLTWISFSRIQSYSLCTHMLALWTSVPAMRLIPACLNKNFEGPILLHTKFYLLSLPQFFQCHKNQHHFHINATYFFPAFYPMTAGIGTSTPCDP